MVVDEVLGKVAQDRVSSYSELAKCGATSAILKELVEEGKMTSVGCGIYASVSLDPFVAAVLATSAYYPQSVISGHTALQIHGLGEEYVDRIDVDIPREKSIRNRLLGVHRVPEKRIIGVTSMPYHGAKIRIYDAERTLCEAYLLDPQGPVFFKALKRYCSSGHVKADVLAGYDQELKTHVTARLRQELADA